MSAQSKPAPAANAFKAKVARIHNNINQRMRKGGIKGSINDAAASSTRNRGVTVTLPRLKFLEGGNV